MKNLISRNWKNVLIIIGAFFIIIDLIYIISTPATIPQDFLEYGPDVEADLVDTTTDVTDEIKDEIEDVDISGDSSSIVTNISESTGLSPDLARGLLVIGGLLLIVLIISAFTDGDGGGAKKK